MLPASVDRSHTQRITDMASVEKVARNSSKGMLPSPGSNSVPHRTEIEAAAQLHGPRRSVLSPGPGSFIPKGEAEDLPGLLRPVCVFPPQCPQHSAYPILIF